MKLPYERFVAWAAGPISIGAGYLATQLVAHVSLFNGLGITQDQTAKAIVAAATFIVGATVTYLAHAKWLDNLGKWWVHIETQQPVTLAPDVLTPEQAADPLQRGSLVAHDG